MVNQSHVVMADEGLVQFLVLAKGAKGAACVALIQQVLSHKKIFVFGELLAMPNVQAVRTRVRLCLSPLPLIWPSSHRNPILR